MRCGGTGGRTPASSGQACRPGRPPDVGTFKSARSQRTGMTDDDTRENVLPGSDETLDTPDVRGYDFRGEFDFFEMLRRLRDDRLPGDPPRRGRRHHPGDARGRRHRLPHVHVEHRLLGPPRGRRASRPRGVRRRHHHHLRVPDGGRHQDRQAVQDGRVGRRRGRAPRGGNQPPGNIFVPSDRYVWLEEYLYDFFEEFFAEEKLRTPRRSRGNSARPSTTRTPS